MHADEVGSGCARGSATRRSGQGFVVGGLLGLLAVACASGNRGNKEAAATTSGVNWSTTAAGGGNGSGGAGAAGMEATSGSAGAGGLTAAVTGTGGGGGATVSSSAGVGGAGGMGGAGGTGSGALVATLAGPTVLVGAVFEQGTWKASVLNGASTHPPAIAAVGSHSALAVYRRAKSAPHLLRFVLWDGATWSSPSDVAAGVSARAEASIHARDGGFDLSFHGDDFKHYFARYVTGWNPTAEPIGSPQSFGPSPAALKQGGASLEVFFAGDDKGLYTQLRSNNAWQGAQPLPGASTQMRPAVVQLSGGEALVVFVRDGDGKLMFNRRQGSIWSNAFEVEGSSFSSLPPRLVALAQDRALLVFRGLDNKLYSSRYEPKASPPWSTPAAIGSPNPVVSSLPALAPGIAGLDAELLYVSSSIAQHCRLSGLTWSAPQTVTAIPVDFVAAASAH